MIQELAIVGVGLLGGSVAKAARAGGLARRVVGVGRDTSRLRPALEDGTLDTATTDLDTGVRKADFARRDYYDLWLPELAPSEPLRAWALSKPFTAQRLAEYAKKYRREMSEPAAQRLIALLAALSTSANFSIGCYCEDESHCHRSLLKALLLGAGARVHDT